MAKKQTPEARPEDGAIADESPTLVRVSVVCSECDYETTIRRESQILDTLGAEVPGAVSYVKCAGCGKRMPIRASQVHEAQHVCLVLLGEA